MRVDADLIFKERERRAWSQEQLADVAGIGFRTVQRIEASGKASLESVAALASVLDLSIDDLRVDDQESHSFWTGKSALRLKTAIVGTLLLTGMLLALNRAAFADQYIVLSVDAVVNGLDRTEAQILNRAGANSEVMIWKDYRLLIVPTVLESGDVRLTLQVQKLKGDEYVQVAAPRVITQDGKQATVKSGWRDGDSIVINITPTIQNAADRS